ncbi:MAG: hypothetical protein QG641_2316 [Candidatus Poribacteria bacterium]|nr:hypothetical protein [Candidatus Poribacteria bacterium]
MGKKQKNYQMNFQETDIEWLANEYKKRNNADPSVTLEDFAIQYGVLADRLRIYVYQQKDGYGNFITLWHGTTMSRAESIIEDGFRPGRESKRRIFFTKNPNTARRYAKGRARREQDQPVIVMCSIDLERYTDYEWQGNEVLAFRYECMDGQVVKRVNPIRN